MPTYINWSHATAKIQNALTAVYRLYGRLSSEMVDGVDTACLIIWFLSLTAQTAFFLDIGTGKKGLVN